MVVGVLRLTLSIPGAASLKDKRQVLRKVTDRLRSRFNVSVAEVGDNDVWQRALIGICAVANDHSFVNQVLDKCVRDAGKFAEIINREMEIETYSEMHAAVPQKPDLDAPTADGQRPTAEGKSEGWLEEDDLP
jgi:uncharacterized protein YlxP (DUF503 family)